MPEKEVLEKFLAKREETGIENYYIHAPYLINLATPDPELLEKSYNNLKGNFEIGQMIQAKGRHIPFWSPRGGVLGSKGK